MPMGRFTVRNEYGLGVKELYKDGVESEDPKAVLDGVAVAGLVGLLRQLGDLSQFAAEVFHGLQEQVASTSSRSRKLVTRVQCVETSLPSLEKAILSQTSHIHFAYTPGSEWHPRSKKEQNHFICDDLPHFIMDSYEECNEPPRLQLLDRFDTGGPGSCLKRYSDPTFFRRASTSSEARNREKSLREKKARKIKRRRSWQRSGQFPNCVPNMNDSDRTQKSSQTSQGESSLSHTGSTFDRTFRSDLGDQSDFLDSKQGLGSVDSISHASIKIQPDSTKNKESFLNMGENFVEINQTNYLNDQTVTAGKDIEVASATETAASHTNVTWDEKLEIMEHMGLNYGIDDDVQHVTEIASSIHEQGLKPVSVKITNHVGDVSEQGSISKSDADQQYTKAIMKSTAKTGLNCLHELDVKHIDANNVLVDDLSELTSSPESNADGHCARTTIDRESTESSEVGYLHEEEITLTHKNVPNFNQMEGLSEHGSSTESNGDGIHPTTILDWNMELTGEDRGIDEVQDLDEENFDLHEHDLVQVNSKPNPQLTNFSEGENAPDGHGLVLANPESFPLMSRFAEGENSLKLITNVNFASEPSDSKLGIGEIQHMLETNDTKNWAIEKLDEDHVNMSLSPVEKSSEGEIGPESTSTDVNFVSNQSDSKLGIGDIQYLLETDLDNAKLEAGTISDEYDGPADSSTEGVNNMSIIQWHLHDDIDSETDNFVDALNTIESESESDYETHTKRKVESFTSMCKPAEKASADLLAEKINLSDMEHECDSRSYNREEGVHDVSEQPTSCQSLAKLECLENAELYQQSKAAMGRQQDTESCFPLEMSEQSPSSFSNVNVDQIGSQSAVCKPVESSSQVSHDDTTACTPNVSGEMPNGSTSSYPLAYWSNGTLLGLQPSKPTVISTSTSVNSAPRSSGNGDLVDQCSLKTDRPTRTMSMPSSVKNYDHGHNFDSDSQARGSLKHMSHDVLGKEYINTLGRDESNINDDSAIPNVHAGVHVSEVPVGADLEKVYSEGTSTSEDRSSLLSLLGRNLMKNGIRRNRSLGYSDKNERSNPLSANAFGNASGAALSDSVPQSKLNVKSQSPVNSPPPSPPLELMKISFRPIDGFETGRLKLKYPEGIDHHEMTVESFPSFQLVPESISVQHDMGSDSDDDTFCRSYPCRSDDSVSHLSDSDSEQWETGDTSESNDHAFYDRVHRISSTESASSSSQHDESDQGNKHVGSRSFNTVHSMLGPTSSQLTTLDPENKFGYAEMKVCLNHEADSTDLQELTPQLPPLPPLQWRVSRPLLDEAEDGRKQGSDSLDQSFHSQLSESAISHPIADVSAKLQSNMRESDSIGKEEKVAEPKLNDQKQNHHAANGNVVDDRGDFLHQIRTKSFNLKRTDKARSFNIPSLASSNKVTAILQKASAIRQAVGSDGEDDSWSDT